MHAIAGFRSMEADAGLRIGAVGCFSALDGREAAILLAGGDDLNAARGKERAQADAEGEVYGFFVLTIDKLTAEIVSAVGCVKNDYVTRGSGDGSGWNRRRRLEGRWARRRGGGGGRGGA